MRKETVYIVFSDYTESLVNFLKSKGYEVFGAERTIEAAKAKIENSAQKPDTFLILSSALVSGMFENEINYGAALIERLKEIRIIAPDSRIVLILPESMGEKVVQAAVYLGIYDIYKKDNVSYQEIITMLATRKTLADHAGVKLPTPEKNTEKEDSEVVIVQPKEQPKKNGFLSSFFKKRFTEEEQADNISSPKQEQDAVSSAPPKERKNRVLLLGRSSRFKEELTARGYSIAADVKEADLIVSDAENFSEARAESTSPVIVYSEKISTWFSPGLEDADIANNPSALFFMIEKHFKEIKLAKKNTPPPQKQLPQTGTVFAFYSGAQGFQGKTVLALNSAVLFTKRGARVCVVDLDTDKAGLTYLLGYSEANQPGFDLSTCIENAEIKTLAGPAGVSVLPAPVLSLSGWFPTVEEIQWLISSLAAMFDYVFLDFGAKLASPPVIEALKMCQKIYIVSTPMRAALSAIARFRGRELARIGSEKIEAIINRVGVRGGLTSRDAASLLGFDRYFEVPEDYAVIEAENERNEKNAYSPPVLKKKNAIAPALERIFFS